MQRRLHAQWSIPHIQQYLPGKPAEQPVNPKAIFSHPHRHSGVVRALQLDMQQIPIGRLTQQIDARIPDLRHLYIQPFLDGHAARQSLQNARAGSTQQQLERDVVFLHVPNCSVAESSRFSVKNSRQALQPFAHPGHNSLRTPMSPDFRAKVNELLEHHYCITLHDIGYSDAEEARFETEFASPDELVDYLAKHLDLIETDELLGRCSWQNRDFYRK